MTHFYPPHLNSRVTFNTLLITIICAGLASTGLAEDTVNLAVKFPKTKQCKILSEIEHDGKVIVLLDDEDSTAKPLPLRVKGELEFYQRMTSPNQAIRFFEIGNANIRLEKGATKPILSDKNRLIVARSKSKSNGRVEMASIQDLLTQNELELLQSPADPLCISALFEKDDLKEGQTWKPEKEALAKFLNVESIRDSNVQFKLKNVNKGMARVYFSGKVIASVFDVTTKIDLHGLALIKVADQQIRSLKVDIRENRPAGQIEPGFDGRTRIDSIFHFDKSTDQLSNKNLSKIARARKIQQRLKYVSQPGAFQINYEPRWKLIAGEADTAILRFIDKGHLITQCNAVLLPARPASNPLSLSKFKEEITKAINPDDNAEVILSDERKTPGGLKSLSVVVEGQEDGLPVNWFYYHVSGEDGRQITFVFTLAENVAVRAKGAAEQLVNEFRFLEKTKKTANSKSNSVGKVGSSRK